MPTIPELVYAALLYKDGNSPATPPSTDFEQGAKAANSDNLIFSFQRPENTSGNFTLEVFAFVKADAVADDGTTTFSRGSALFSGSKDRLVVNSDTIDVGEEPIALSSSKSGTVNLKVTVPEGCSLEIDDTAKAKFKCERESETPNTYSITASEISASAYPVTFTVKKGAEIVHIFSEYINVINGLCTDTWSGLEKGVAKDVANSISKTVYVRGTGGWYETSTYNASDENSGSFSSPLATIQKAIDKVIAINDGTSEYIIKIDGTLTQNTLVENMASIAPDTSLNLKIESLSADTEATLNAANNGRVMSISSDRGGIPNVTLKNIHITGGNATENGGGVYVNGGTFTMDDGKISGCIATKNGGGVYITSNGTFNMSETAKITECNTTSTDSNTGGGGIYSEGTLAITGGTISKCISANYGGGVFVNGGTFVMSGSTKISGNEAVNGGAVYIKAGTFTMNGGTIGGENEEDGNTAKYKCGGVYAGGGRFRMEGGTISGNNSYGVYMNDGYFYMSGAAKVESNNVVYGNSSNPIYIAGALTATPLVATFYLSTYEADRIVLRADTGVTIDEDICSKIALTDEGCKIVPSADGKTGVLKVHTIFLNSENGSDSKYGVNASTQAVKTLSKAIEKYDTYNAEKIMVCAPYTLPSEESDLLDRTDTTHLTLMRYAGSSDGSGALTGNLLTVSQGSVGIFNTTLDGNKENVSAEGSLLYISGSTTTVSLGTDATLCNNKTSQSGGAVYINEGTFEMTGGTITGNETMVYGGGVFVRRTSTFEMCGGTISGNKAGVASGGGVYIGVTSSAVGTFTMSAAAKVESDNDVYLYNIGSNFATITVAGALTAESPVATIMLPASYNEARQVLSADGTNVTAITQDICDKFALSSVNWKIAPNADGTAGVVQLKSN